MTKGKKGRPRSARNAKTVSLTVTPEAWEMFRDMAENMGMTRSELLERIARGTTDLSSTHYQIVLGELLAS